MTDDARTIFRRDALQHFMEGREPSVLPRYIRPRTFACLWILLVIVVLAAVLVATARVPTYVMGPAVVTQSGQDIVLSVLLPAEVRPRLKVGQRVLLWRSNLPEPIQSRVLAVGSGILSPAVARQRFGLSSDTIRDPVAVVTTPTDEIHGALPTSAPLEPGVSFDGSILSAKVEVGQRSALALILGVAGSETTPQAGTSTGGSTSRRGSRGAMGGQP